MTKVVPHKHCLVCGKAVDGDWLYCGDECENEFNKSQRKQKLFFVGFLVLMVLLMVWSLFTSPK